MKKRKKIIIIAVVAVVIAAAAIASYFILFRNGNGQHKTAVVSFGSVIKEVSETGAVKISEKIDLSFKYAGRIDEVYVKVGDKVLASQNIAKTDTSQVYIELAQSQAALDIAQADYNKLLAGSSLEEIRVAKADVNNSQVALNNAEQNLKDVQTDAKEGLSQDYQDAVDDLDDAYLKLDNAYIDINYIQIKYFTSSDQEGINFRDNKDVLERSANNSKNYIDQAKSDYSQLNIDTALSNVKAELSKAKDALLIIRSLAESVAYRNVVPAASKTIIDNHKSYVNTAYASIIAAIQTISADKITNENNINTAQATVDSAKAALEKAKEQLSFKEAGPTQENIDLYFARVKQAEAQVFLSQNKTQEAVLKSPASGQITDIYKRRGEVVQASEPVLGFLTQGPLQVEADIYEEDIVYVDNGDLVKIILPAFPNDELKGRVILVDPAEKIIDGVVYYQVDIIFEDAKEGIKPGMTADIVIDAAKKENVLVVPRQAVKKEDGKRVVKVLKGKSIETREIQAGLEGDDFTEVISGLAQGEQVIID